MTKRLTVPVTVCALLALAAIRAAAADKVVGTFTVNGKTTQFTQVYATLEGDPVQASRQDPCCWSPMSRWRPLTAHRTGC